MGTPGPHRQSHTMKLLLLVSALSLASGTKLGAVTCDECKAASQGLVERLTTDASLEEQAGILIATLCPQAPDADACEAGITQWWADMARCLYPEFLGGADVCIRLELCPAAKNPLVREWTCEECTDIMGKVALFIKDPETVTKGVAYLQGESFWRRPPSCARMWSVCARICPACCCPTPQRPCHLIYLLPSSENIQQPIEK